MNKRTYSGHGRLVRDGDGKPEGVHVYAWGDHGETVPVASYHGGAGGFDAALELARQGDAIIKTSLGFALVRAKHRKG